MAASAGGFGAKDSWAGNGGMALAEATAFLEAAAFLEATCLVAGCFAAKELGVVSSVANAKPQRMENLENVLIFMTL